MILRVAAVSHLGAYRLRIRFSDGAEGVVDLADVLWGPMFEPLRDIGLFCQARVDQEIGTVVWPNGADLAPEYVHARLQKGVESGN